MGIPTANSRRLHSRVPVATLIPTVDMKLRKSRERFAVGNDATAGGVSEKDAIAAINQAKGYGKDSKSNAEKPAESVPQTIAGSDTATQPEEAQPEAVADSQPAPVVTLQPEELKALIGDAVLTALSPVQEQLDATQTQLGATTQDLAVTKQELQTTQTDLQTAKQERDRLAGVFQVMGKATPVNGVDRGFPMVNKVTSTRSDRAIGAAADFLNIYEDSSQTPKYAHENSQGNVVVSKDFTNLKRFLREGDSLQHVRNDMEAYAKANGLLRASLGRDNTTKVTIPDGFLAYLSTVMRMTHNPSFIFWQFIKVKLDMGRGQGDAIKVPRFAYNSAPTNSSARLLSGNGTYARITNSRQGLTQGSVSCLLQEWGLGLDANSPPILIPQFVSANSIIELESILQRNLNYDYEYWEDMKIRELWAPSSRVVYNSKGFVTATPADLVASSDGTLTESFMDDLYGYMRGLQIPTYEDGCYGLATHSKGRSQIRKSLNNKFQYTGEQGLEELVNTLSVATNQEMGKVSGYLGKISNFHVFETNATSMGAAGTEGVQNETLGAGSKLTRTSYAFGADTIGRGVGSEMEIRRSNDDDFQRSDSYIWRSEEGFCPLDVDPTGYSDASTVPQQLRVIKVNTTDVAL
ncbi:MAG: hypothetical protein KME43_16420 [Myxacorys chilensis ATA2-1-KO14]|nr:hypothetical protein [Myxacorys chilensis ATA2-1-KO14]